MEAGARHDYTKLTMIDAFHRDFVTGFKKTSWWEEHKKKERHHLIDNEHAPQDVNLVDVIECIVDGVMAGMARSGDYRYTPFPAELLERAVKNTISMLLDNVKMEG